MKQLIDMLKELATGRFWGEVSIKFQDGKIVHVSKNQIIDPKVFSG